MSISNISILIYTETAIIIKATFAIDVHKIFRLSRHVEINII